MDVDVIQAGWEKVYGPRVHVFSKSVESPKEQ